MEMIHSYTVYDLMSKSHYLTRVPDGLQPTWATANTHVWILAISSMMLVFSHYASYIA